MNGGRTVTTAAYQHAKIRVVEYLATHPSITNRILRTIAPIDYDQAIYVLGKLCADEVLERRGNAGGTHYLLAKSMGHTTGRNSAKRKERSGNDDNC